MQHPRLGLSESNRKLKYTVKNAVKRYLEICLLNILFLLLPLENHLIPMLSLLAPLVQAGWPWSLILMMCMWSKQGCPMFVVALWLGLIGMWSPLPSTVGCYNVSLHLQGPLFGPHGQSPLKNDISFCKRRAQLEKGRPNSKDILGTFLSSHAWI